ncbi:MAG: putative oxidoreductase [Kiritimatiellia bacterium]|jgi:putative oxidoreductase
MLNKVQDNSVIVLVGRVLLGLLFFMGGLKLFTGGVPIEYAATGAKFVALPAFLVWVGFAVKLVAGAGVILGFQTRLAALSLAVFTLITAFNFHYIDNFFWKELCIVGGLLILAAHGAGCISLDAKFKKE